MVVVVKVMVQKSVVGTTLFFWWGWWVSGPRRNREMPYIRYWACGPLHIATGRVAFGPALVLRFAGRFNLGWYSELRAAATSA